MGALLHSARATGNQTARPPRVDIFRLTPPRQVRPRIRGNFCYLQAHGPRRN